VFCSKYKRTTSFLFAAITPDVIDRFNELYSSALLILSTPRSHGKSQTITMSWFPLLTEGA